MFSQFTFQKSDQNGFALVSYSASGETKWQVILIFRCCTCVIDSSIGIILLAEDMFYKCVVHSSLNISVFIYKKVKKSPPLTVFYIFSTNRGHTLFSHQGPVVRHRWIDMQPMDKVAGFEFLRIHIWLTLNDFLK